MRQSAFVSLLVPALLVVSAVLGSAQASNSQGVNIKAIRALWSSIKKQLSGPNGVDYFHNALENADLPLLIGTLISATPEQQPSTLVLTMSDGTTPEVTLRLKDDSWRDAHLSGPVMRGSQIQFEGVPSAFTQNPFMLTFDVQLTPKTTHTPIPELAPDH